MAVLFARFNQGMHGEWNLIVTAADAPVA